MNFQTSFCFQEAQPLIHHLDHQMNQDHLLQQQAQKYPLQHQGLQSHRDLHHRSLNHHLVIQVLHHQSPQIQYHHRETHHQCPYYDRLA